MTWIGGPEEVRGLRAEVGRLQAENDRLRLVHDIAERSIRGCSLTETVAFGLNRLRAMNPASRVAFGTIDDDGAIYVERSLQPDGMVDLSGLRVDLTVAPAYLSRLREGRALVVEDVAREPLLAPLAETLAAGGARALVDVPVWFSGDMLGLLCLDNPAPTRFSPDTVELLRWVADQLAIARAHAERDEAQAASVECAALNARRLEALLRSLEGGVLVEDERRRIVLANPRLCELFGIPAPPEALVGADCDDAAQQSKALFRDQEGFIGRVADILRARAPVTGEVLELADGRVFERDYVPVELDTMPRGHLWHYRDVTAKHRMLRRLEQVATARADLLANMSHEIRTPMNGVTGMLELLSTFELEDGADECVRVARSSAKTLLTLIDDILDLSKAESGRLELEAVPVSVVRVARESLDTFLAAARAKGLALRLESDDVRAPCRLGDQVRLRQVLANLVSNAIKFTEAGSVTLRVREGEDEALRFEVEDTGVGISRAHLDSIFDEFDQGDRSTQRVYGGTGLGLSICRRLAALMGGALEVQSEPGQGSTFTFTVLLPVSTTPSVSSEATAPPPSSAETRGRRVLLVEDNAVNQRVAQRMLERLGCAVTVVEDGEQGRRRAVEGAFDLVLMDCRMPVMDGFEATRRIRAALGDEAPPIVALSANAFPEDRARSLEAGMAAHLSKPVTLEALRDVLARFGAHLGAARAG